MPLKVVTPPAVEPVTLEQFRLAVPSADDQDDALVGSSITSSRQWLEMYLERAIVPQTLAFYLDSFPCGPIQLPRPPLVGVTSFTYVAGDGLEYELEEDVDFYVDNISEPGWVAGASSWPSPIASMNVIKIQYEAGWEVEEVPEPIKQAIILGAGSRLSEASSVASSSGEIRSLSLEGVGSVGYATTPASTSSSSSAATDAAIKALVDFWRVF